MPPTEYEGVACWQESLPSKTEGAVEEVDSSACSVETEASGSLDS